MIFGLDDGVSENERRDVKKNKQSGSMKVLDFLCGTRCHI